MELFIDLVSALSGPLIALMTLLFFAKRIWYYLLKEVIQEKINDLQKSKKAVSGLVTNILLDLEDDQNYGFHDPVNEEVLERRKEACKDVSDRAFYSSRGLATPAFYAHVILQHTDYKDVSKKRGKNMKGKDEVGKWFISAMSISSLDKFFSRSMGLVESHSFRSVEMPKGISIKKRSWLPSGHKSFFKGAGVNYIKGIEQGPAQHPLDISAAEFFYVVLGTHCNITDYIFHKRYFQLMRKNIIFYNYFLNQKIYFPLELDFNDSYSMGESKLFLISVEPRCTIGCNKASRYHLIYANLVDNYKFAGSVKNDDIFKLFGEGEEGKETTISRYNDLEVFKIDCSLDVAVNGFKENKWKMRECLRVETERSLVPFYFDTLRPRADNFITHIASLGGFVLGYMDKVFRKNR